MVDVYDLRLFVRLMGGEYIGIASGCSVEKRSTPDSQVFAKGRVYRKVRV